MSRHDISGSGPPGRALVWRFALAYLLVAPLTVILLVTNPDAGAPRSTTSSIDAVDPTPQAPMPPLVTRIELDDIPISGHLAAFGALWLVVEDREDHSLSLVRMDSEGGETRTVPAGMRTPLIVVAGFDALWISGCPNRRPGGSCGQSALVRLDPATMEITDQVRVDGNITSLAAGPDAMWLGQWTYVNNVPQPGYVFRLDPGTLTLHRYPLEALKRKGRPPCCVRGLAAGDGALWMMYGDWSRLVRLDPSTGGLTQLDAYGGELQAGLGAVWVVGRTHRRASGVEGTLRIDPETNEVTGVGPVAASVTAENGQVWVVEKSGDLNDRTLTVERLDTATGQPIGRPIRVEAGPPKINFECGGCGWHVTIAYGEGSVWLTIMDALEVIRITPAP